MLAVKQELLAPEPVNIASSNVMHGQCTFPELVDVAEALISCAADIGTAVSSTSAWRSHENHDENITLGHRVACHEKGDAGVGVPPP